MKSLTLVTVTQEHLLISADTLSFALVKINEQSAYIRKPYLLTLAAVMTLHIFPSIFCALEILFLSPLIALLTSSEKVHFCVHSVEIDLLADVSNVLSLVPYKLDFYFLLRRITFTATAESSRVHSNTVVAAWYIYINSFCISHTIAERRTGHVKGYVC